MKRATIIGTGSFLPEKVRNNEWFERLNLISSGTDIFDKSGIETRRIVADGMMSSDMEIAACKNALEKSGIDPKEIDLILCNSNIHDQLQPGNACLIQHKIGAKNAGAFNFDSACTSFINCLILANSLIASDECKTILIVSSTTWTRVADYTEKKCMIMGDGAGAVIVKAAKKEGRGYLGSSFSSLGEFYSLMGRKIKKPEGWEGERTYYGEDPEKLYLFIDRTQEGLKKIQELAPRQTVDITHNALEKCNLKVRDIDFFLCHQPAQDLVTSWRDGLNLRPGQYHDTLKKYGNLSNASIPVTLDEAQTTGLIKEDGIVVFSAPGMGWNLSSVVFRWGD